MPGRISVPRRRALLAAACLGLLGGTLTSAPAVAAPAAAAAVPSARSSAPTWRNVAIGGGGFITGVVFNQSKPGLAYLRTDIGGLYRWDAPAKRWTPLLDWTGFADYNQLGVESVATSAQHPNRVWAAVGEYSESWNAGNDGAILRSDDYGRTWKRTQLPILMGSNDQGRDSGERLAVDPDDDDILYFGSRDDGLWKSTDGGVTWAEDTAFPDAGSGSTSGLQFVTFDQTANSGGGKAHGGRTPTRHLVVGDADTSTLYESTDAGASWSTVAGGPGTIPIKAQFAADGRLYVVYDAITGPYWMGAGALYRYAKGSGGAAVGAATDITPDPSWYGYDALALDPEHPGTVIVSTNDRWSPIDTLYRSTDGGTTWKDVSASSTLDVSSTPFLNWGATPKFGWWIGTVAIDPFDPGHVVYGTGATLFGTDDLTAIDSGGTAVFSSKAVNGVEETAVNDLLVPALPGGSCRLVSALGDLGGFCHTSLTRSPSTGMSTDPLLGTGTGLAQSTDGGLMARVGTGGDDGADGGYSTDGGATWTPFTDPAGLSTGSGSVAVTADGGAIVWSAGDGTGVYRSTDRGTTWTTTTGLTAGLHPVADPVDPAILHALDPDAGVLYTSTDGGSSFTATATGLPTGGNEQLKATPGVKGDLWLSALDHGLLHSTDGGKTWTTVASASSSYTLGFGKAAPRSRYATMYQVGIVDGVTGVFMSTDDARSWTRINSDAQNWGWTGQVITGDMTRFGRVYLGTNGRGIQTVDVDGNG
jgi:xyloglucan-specific exo-beta-1,4-glucanase